ncbi:non-ribosomal peptide synthetase [Burkholderia glumae]|uniref:non-ribosomal peptide synthetase n=1 Tax=Burkholderia glumae TaxID=337 RepID=UPI00030BEA0B|nr:non-ribosomal peptide synthetase [Burkholderia glumae]MCM2495853.1 non-ribosomal peptide synthetase [Burkholderia glumae]MCM2546813.1 non-ribosomal peptide synthetase [Burkholderia glumae]PJO22674.1 non-ribosomal peptide synthetase [Burkholderia glumae AU6208]QHE13166.1 non-ribosomal peptide synthetase [Burkholderia glumae AU6208]
MSTTPLSAYQYRFWLEWRLAPHSAAYTTALVYRLIGPLRRDALQQALEAFVHEHDEGCRSVFRDDGGDPVRIVHPRIEVDLEYRDARGDGPAQPALDAAARDAWIAERAATVFALDRAPLFRFSLLREDDATHRLVLAFPHIISDAFSARYINARLSALYNHALGAGPAPDRTHRDLDGFLALEAEYRASGARQADLDYWLALLGEAPLGVDLPAPETAEAGARDCIHRMHFDATVAQALKACAKANRSTPFLLLSSLFAIALARWLDLPELVLSYPVNLRSPGFEQTSGCFVNNLPMPIALRDDDSFRDVFARTTAQRAASRRRQRLALTDLVAALRRRRTLADEPIFNVGITEAFFTQSSPLDFRQVASELLPAAATERPLDLNFAYQLTPDGLHVNLEHDTRHLSPARIAAFAARFERLLAACLADDTQAVHAVALLGAEERERLSRFWHGPARALDDSHWYARFAAQCAASPDAIAVEAGETRLSYRELDASSARLAGALAARGVVAGSRVGLCCERSPEMVLAIVAVLRCGAAYIPLDPEAPPERVSRIVADASPVLLLTQRRLAPRLPAATVPQLLLDDATWREAAPLPPQAIPPEAIAYVIYTSGSTGMPKGVANTHRALLNRLDWQNTLLRGGITARTLQKTPYTFDVSVWELLWPLLNGAALVVAPPGLHRDPTGLASLMREAGVAVAHFVPSMLNAFLDVMPGRQLPDLALVICSGEALLAEQAERFRRLLPGTRLVNLYGPTEAAIDVSAWPCESATPAGRAGIPIGRPIDNVSLYVLDSRLSPCPPGQRGELYIGGAALAAGYLGRPDLTAASFVPDPLSDRPGARMYRTGDIAMFGEHGELHYLGRRDEQVKLNGNRIELREIEACLLALPGVAQCAVVPVAVNGRIRHLHGFVEPAAGGQRWAEGELEDWLASRLPEVMRPARIEVVERIALLTAGKIDRKRLRQQAQAALERTASTSLARPKTAFQRDIATEWSAVLETGEIGADENFFMLGGSSVQAIQLIGRLNRRFGLLLTPAMLFNAPQLDRFSAQVLAELGRHAQREGTLAALLDGLGPEDMDELLKLFEARELA